MNTAHKACPVCNHTLLGHEHDGWTCDCHKCPWKTYNQGKSPIVTIRAENLKPGDIIIHKIGGPCPQVREHKVLTVFRKEWPDRVNVGLTYLDGDHKVEWDYRPYNHIQVRRTGDQSFQISFE